MTEPNKPGNKHIPDFNELNDRVIAETPMLGQTLVIKTNLDPKNSTEENPYLQNETPKNKQQFRDYFEQ